MPHAPCLFNTILKAKPQVLVDVLAYVISVEMHTPKVFSEEPGKGCFAGAG
jgi:hypothetical protein